MQPSNVRCRRHPHLLGPIVAGGPHRPLSRVGECRRAASLRVGECRACRRAASSPSQRGVVWSRAGGAETPPRWVHGGDATVKDRPRRWVRRPRSNAAIAVLHLGALQAHLHLPWAQPPPTPRKLLFFLPNSSVAASIQHPSPHSTRGAKFRCEVESNSNPGVRSSCSRRELLEVASAAEMAPAAAEAAQKSQTPPESFGVSMYPLHRSKVIHIVRHGQGFHNVAGELDHANYMSWDYADASLTDLGWQQSQALHQHLEATGIKAQVELIVVSPLLRTLQTASGVWGGATLPEQESSSEELLMVGGLGKAPHPAIAAPKPPLKFIANEWCREQNGVHPCDRRSSITFYKKHFPHVDFSEVGTDEDTWWSETKRETAQDLFTRARTFIRWLLDRPESRIAVVSHSSFIFHMCHLFGAECSDVVRKEIQQGFRNCEMRSVVISDRLASGSPNMTSTDFAGGLHYNDPSKKDKVPTRQVVAEDSSVPQADSLATEEQEGPSFDAQGEEIVSSKQIPNGKL